MYSSPGALILGFHGCDKKVGEAVLNGSIAHLKKSENDYDWLADGIYFWENSPDRALQFAKDLKANPRRGKQRIATICTRRDHRSRPLP